MKKLPRDAEASNVLVGEVDFLENPFIAFVRLKDAVMFGSLTEVPVPTRYNNTVSSLSCVVYSVSQLAGKRICQAIVEKVRFCREERVGKNVSEKVSVHV